MEQNGESGHSVFRDTNALERGDFKSKGGGKKDYSLQRKWRNRWSDSSHGYFCQSVQYLRSSRRLVQRIRPRFKSYWTWDLWIFGDTDWDETNNANTTSPSSTSHSETCCKIISRNSLIVLMIRNCRNCAPTLVSWRKFGKNSLHYDWRRIRGYADIMSRIHTTSRPENIPTERVDSFEYENRPSLVCTTLSSWLTLLCWCLDRILVQRPHSFMGSCCVWSQQIRHRSVRRKSHWERPTVHKHKETCCKD